MLYSSLLKIHLIATERHLLYAITQCCCHPTQVNDSATRTIAH